MSLVAIPQKYSPIYRSSSPERSSMQMAAARERLPHWVSYFPSELKTLDAVILAVSDVHPAVVVDFDVVDDVELAVSGPRFAPRELEPAVGRVLMHPGVGIAVGHVEFSGAPVESHVSGNAERFAAHFGAGLVGRGQGSSGAGRRG